MHERDRVEIERACEPDRVGAVDDAHEARFADPEVGQIEGLATGHERIGGVELVLVDVREHRVPASAGAVRIARRAAVEGPSAATYDRPDTTASLGMGVLSLTTPVTAYLASFAVPFATGTGRGRSGRIGKVVLGVAAVMLGAAAGEEWARAERWPPSAPDMRALYLDAGGQAEWRAPSRQAQTSFAVDYDVSCPGDSYFLFGPCVIDESGAAFTSAPLEEDMRLVGGANAYVWLSSSIDRANLFVYLEEVSSAGEVRILTHGRLGAAYRRVSPAPYDTLGQPWHSGFEADQEALPPGQIVEMAVPLLPTAQIVRAGARLRLTVAGADPRQRDLQSLRIDPPPTLTVHTGSAYASRVELPVARR